MQGLLHENITRKRKGKGRSFYSFVETSAHFVLKFRSYWLCCMIWESIRPWRHLLISSLFNPNSSGVFRGLFWGGGEGVKKTVICLDWRKNVLAIKMKLLLFYISKIEAPILSFTLFGSDIFALLKESLRIRTLSGRASRRGVQGVWIPVLLPC